MTVDDRGDVLYITALAPSQLDRGGGHSSDPVMDEGPAQGAAALIEWSQLQLPHPMVLI